MDATANRLTGPGTSYNQKPSESYESPGVRLSPLREETNPGDWRLAHFALAFPVPEETRLRDFDAEYHGDAARPGWRPGRFNGIACIGSRESGGYAKTFHNPAQRYFKGPLRGSVGVFPSDGEDYADQYDKYSGREKIDVKSWKYLYVQDYYGDEECVYPVAPEWSLELGHGKVTLAAIEYLRFLDPKQSVICPDLAEQIAKEHNETRFVVLHVLGEHLTSLELQQLSAALRRPNRTVPALRMAKSEEQSLDGPKLLYLLADEVRDKLGIQDPDTFVMTKGGFFTVDSEKREPTDSVDDGYDIVRPIHTVCALPAAQHVDPPAIAFASADNSYTQWSWQLATLADEYYAGVPDFSSADELQVQRSNSWIAGFSVNGLSLVRTNPIDFHDIAYMILTGTRYLDLALLVRRAGRYLDRLSRQLRKLRFEENETARATHEGHADGLEEANRELVRNLESFQALQRDFIVFRDYLWFDSVSGKPRDTKLLQGMLKATGVWQQYADVADEMQLRREFYDMREGNLRLQLGRLRDEKRQAAREASAKEERRNADNDKTLTYLLGIAALVLAVIPLVELSGGQLLIALGVILAGALGCVGLYVRQWKKAPRENDEAV